MKRLDTRIAGALICNGERPAFPGDVGIRDGRIVCVGDSAGWESDNTVDGAGLTLLPGFVDTHTHTDLVRFFDPSRKDALLQGVTTEITGACGIGCYPLEKGDGAYIDSVAGLYGCTGEGHCFPSLRAYFDALPPLGVNTAAQVSHSPIRYRVLGAKDAPLEGAALERAQSLLEDAFRDGACALSTGLAYYPASFGGRGEICALARIAAKYRAPVTVHQRTALRTPDPGFDPRREVLDIGRETGAAMVYSHFRTNYANLGHPEIIRGFVEAGRASGVDVTADLYPFPVGCGYLAVQLPMEVMDGGIDAIVRRLSDPAQSEEIARKMLALHPNLADGRIVHCPATPDYLGLTYEAAAEKMGVSVEDMAVRLLAENRLAVAYMPLVREASLMGTFEDDVASLLKTGLFMGGSDSLPMLSLRHPRCRSTFPKLLRIAREHGISMAHMAKCLSALPCETYHLAGRGKIKEGCAADLVLLDANTVRETGDFDHPEAEPVGIRGVWVGGVLSAENGRITDALAGKPIRREAP